ncbi:MULTISPECIES: hypothetical protein [Neobacillus]|jgi:hypothetical protein|uniref:Uncharacterized protein n=1 Tax=Neobacillus sedimentimangrovi TaxID=2699460 RepID=A0ABS8QFB7_9BACI|nr:hypothetical protein [Neobacillus sedimentimangrovi]AIM17335.1 hypothetical protein HW35_14765 [Bacillus sp. X1(2014)]MCD4837851.1 hypothetical protein [Neobacillus sedimentimangrovi]
MNYLLTLFLAVLAGFALLRVEVVSFLDSLTPILQTVGSIAIIIFSFALLYHGFKALISRE